MNELGTNYLSVRQLAAHFGLSIPTIRRWMADGLLQSTRIGSRIRFSPENILQFINDSGQKHDAYISSMHRANEEAK
jgi:excisionase family DNA binding protein